MPFHPFSDNIIFYDAEFSSLDIYHGELLSIGLVKYTGEELYVEIESDAPVSDWMKENLPELLASPDKVSKEDAQAQIRAFIGDTEPYLVAYVNQFDMAFWHKLFHQENHEGPYTDYEPSYWVPIDFASMLFAHGYDPEALSTDRREEAFADFTIDFSAYKNHNALDDARLLREIYMKLATN